MRSTSATLNRLSARYADSLQCFLWSASALPLESLLPIIASVVLHLCVPLLYFRFDESRTALGWFAVCFIVAHSLYHCCPLTIGEAISVARICTLLPMTFELWMSAGQWRRKATADSQSVGSSPRLTDAACLSRCCSCLCALRR